MTSTSLEEQKARAEIHKFEAEATEKYAQVDALKRGNNWWVKYSPLVLALLALFGGWTQYTRLSMEDREKSIDAKLAVLSAQEDLENAQAEQLVAETALLKAQNELALAQKELAENRKALEITVAEIKSWEGDRKEIEGEIAARNKELLKLASDAGADSQAVETIKQSSERTLQKFSDFEINQQILIEQGFQRF